VDGSCIGNHLHDKTKRKSFVAYLVYDEKEKVEEVLKRVKATTNQQAEWLAVIEALKYCQANVPGEQIEIFSDCKNVVNIANGKSQARQSKMIQLYEKFKKCVAGLNVKLTWVPRGENEAGKHIESKLSEMRK